MARHFQIPEEFFKKIAEKGKVAEKGLYSRIWFYWFSEFVDDIFEPEFLEKQVKAFPKVSEIKDIYEFGVQLLRQDFKIVEIKGKKKRAEKPVPREIRKTAIQVLEYLNQQAGTGFELKGSNVQIIAARMEEGFNLTDFKVVIEKKVKDWRGTDWEKYLRPITLFAKSKFENYLNGINEQHKSTKFDQFADSIAKAQQFIKLRQQS